MEHLDVSQGGQSVLVQSKQSEAIIKLSNESRESPPDGLVGPHRTWARSELRDLPLCSPLLCSSWKSVPRVCACPAAAGTRGHPFSCLGQEPLILSQSRTLRVQHVGLGALCPGPPPKANVDVFFVRRLWGHSASRLVHSVDGLFPPRGFHLAPAISQPATVAEFFSH